MVLVYLIFSFHNLVIILLTFCAVFNGDLMKLNSLPTVGRGDIPALTPTEAGTRLSDPGGMQG